MRLIPYKAFGPLQFGVSTKDDCLRLLGDPLVKKTRKDGVVEFEYSSFIIRFGSQALSVQECTLIPGIDASLDETKIAWDKEFLEKVCALDGEPQWWVGFIILRNLGIAISGIHENDESQKAITAFSFQDLDWWLKNTVPFSMDYA